MQEYFGEIPKRPFKRGEFYYDYFNRVGKLRGKINISRIDHFIDDLESILDLINDRIIKIHYNKDPISGLNGRSPGAVRIKLRIERAIAVSFLFAIKSWVSGLTLKDIEMSLNDLLARSIGTLSTSDYALFISFLSSFPEVTFLITKSHSVISILNLIILS